MEHKTGEKKIQNESLRDPSPSDVEVLQFKEDFLFWFFAWLATSFSGAISVAWDLQGDEALAALVVGSILIGVCATPIIPIVAVVTRGLCLTRYRLYTASLASGLSCSIAAMIYMNATHSYLSDGWELVILEALSGSIGCPLILYLIGRTKLLGNQKEEATKTLNTIDRQ